jgi:hypothetical protein
VEYVASSQHIGCDAYINAYQINYEVTSILCFTWSCFESTVLMRQYTNKTMNPRLFLIIRNIFYLHLHAILFLALIKS